MSAILNTPSADYIFRKMRETDLAQVMAIEESVYNFPWTLGIFQDCLNVGYFCWVLEEKNKVVAYSIMSVAADESHLLTIVVSKDKQGQGYGRKLLDEMIRVATINGAHTMYLEVRVTNTAAISLYDQRGFNELGVRSNYYPAKNGREDALIFALDLKPERDSF